MNNFSLLHKTIFDWLDKRYSGMSYEKSIFYTHSAILRKDGKIITIISIDELFAVENEITDFMTNIFGIDYSESKSLIWLWLNNTYDIPKIINETAI